MENIQQNEQEEQITKEEIGATTIGAELPPLQPKKCKVTDYKIETVHNAKGQEVGHKVVLICQHPDLLEKPIEISSVKYLKGKILKNSALWLNKDKDNKIPYNSALAITMRYYEQNTLKQMIGVYLETVTDENGYLIAKAY